MPIGPDYHYAHASITVVVPEMEELPPSSDLKKLIVAAEKTHRWHCSDRTTGNPADGLVVTEITIVSAHEAVIHFCTGAPIIEKRLPGYLKQVRTWAIFMKQQLNHQSRTSYVWSAGFQMLDPATTPVPDQLTNRADELVEAATAAA